MKKLLVLLMVLAFVAPALADDTLDLSGTMRVRAWNINNSNYTDADTADLNYWDQRLRIQGVISPADGVKAVFRIDLSEDTWGGNNWAGSRYDANVKGVNYSALADLAEEGIGSEAEAAAAVNGTVGGIFGDNENGGEIQVDRAYLDVTKGIFNIKAGQQYMGLGNNFAYDNNTTGLQITLNTPVTVRVGYSKEDEDQSNKMLEEALSDAFISGIKVPQYGTKTNLSDAEGYEDLDRYFIDLGYKTDAFAVNVFYAMQQDGLDDGDEPTLLGAMAKFNVGPAAVMGEFNMFGGQNGDVDYVGMQFIGDVSMKFSDALTAGVNLIYSSGEDEADEEKITKFAGAFGSAAYSDLGPFNTDIMPLGGDDVFDPAGTNSGAMGAGIYANFTVMPGLTLNGQYVYLTAAEDGTDNRADGFDSGYVIAVGALYTLTDNATLAAEYLMADWDTIEDADIEALNCLVARIEVAF